MQKHWPESPNRESTGRVHAKSNRLEPRPEAAAPTTHASANMECVTEQHEVFLVTEQGQIIRMKAGDMRPIGRDTQGVRLMDLADGDKLVSIATLREPDEANGESGE